MTEQAEPIPSPDTTATYSRRVVLTVTAAAATVAATGALRPAPAAAAPRVLECVLDLRTP